MSAARIPLVVLGSGRGSNFEALDRAIRGGALHAEIGALICDRPDAPILSKAKAAGIPAFAVPPPADATEAADRRIRHGRALLDAITPHRPRFLVLAGFMRVLDAAVIEEFRSERGYARVVNVHPALLPAFPGLDSYARAFAHGVRVTGVTVHLVEPEVDSGPICAQEAFSIANMRSAAEVEAWGLELEHRLLPETLGWVLPERFDVEAAGQGRLRVRPN